MQCGIAHLSIQAIHPVHAVALLSARSPFSRLALGWVIGSIDRRQHNVTQGESVIGLVGPFCRWCGINVRFIGS